MIGCKGRMNVALYRIWHSIRGLVLKAIWDRRNARIYHKVIPKIVSSKEGVVGIEQPHASPSNM